MIYMGNIRLSVLSKKDRYQQDCTMNRLKLINHYGNIIEKSYTEKKWIEILDCQYSHDCNRLSFGTEILLNWHTHSQIKSSPIDKGQVNWKG